MSNINESFTDTLRQGLGGSRKDIKIIQASGKNGDLTKNYFGSLSSDVTNRLSRYKEYDAMDEGLISTALDLIVDDATQYDKDQGTTAWASSNTPKITDALNELFSEIINVDEVISDWARQTAKYGDFFVRVYGEDGKGIVRVDDSYHPSEVERVDRDGELEGFYETTETGKVQSLHPWEFVHFKIQGSPKRKPTGKLELRYQKISGKTRSRVSTKYGSSILENAIVPNKKLNMLEDSLVLARLARSPLKRIYLINVGNANVKEASSTISFFKNIMKKRQSIGQDGTFKSENHPFTSEEEVFVPVNDVKNDIDVREFGGDVDVKGIADIEFVKNKLMAALKTPQAFLGFEESLNGRNTLRQLDARYARTTKKVQTAVVRGLVRLAQIHLAFLQIDPDPSKFQIEMGYVSTIEELERQEALAVSAQSQAAMVGLLTELDPDGTIIDKAQFIHYLLKEQFHFSDEYISKITKLTVDPAPETLEPISIAGDDTTADQEVETEPDEEIPTERKRSLINTGKAIRVYESSKYTGRRTT